MITSSPGTGMLRMLDVVETIGKRREIVARDFPTLASAQQYVAMVDPSARRVLTVEPHK